MPKSCTICHSPSHTQFYCRKKARAQLRRKSQLRPSRKPLKVESDKARTMRIRTYKAWIKANPPDERGYWYCYLQISSLCPVQLKRETLTLEHVKSRSSHPHLKYDIGNIKSSCRFCNRAKGSQSLEQLAKSFPHLQVYLHNM